MVKNKFNPKVSIVIPVYNGSNYLKEAIDSALAQTYKNIEIIVVNDGSTDNGATEKIALSYGGKIRYFKKTNGGVATALNFGIEKMTGDYFSWLSHDDMYRPNKIEIQIRFLEQFKNRKIVLYSNYYIYDVSRNVETKVNIPTTEFENKPEYLLFREALNGITLLVPRIAFDRCGVFNVNLRTTQDYDMWFKFMQDGYEFVHQQE
jgi:glycosyltransferase involved in cell wall biosynthesis